MTSTTGFTFGDPINFGVGDNPTALATGDFNGEGNLDLVTANFGSIGNVDLQSPSVLLGDGTGRFSAVRNLGRAFSDSSVVVGDFNNDRNLDLVTLATGGGVSLFLGTGAGDFNRATSFGVGNPVLLRNQLQQETLTVMACLI